MAETLNRAMVLAAGKGLRMRPLTEKTPKPMLTLNGQPMIDHVLDRLVETGVVKAVVNTHHLSGQIERHLSTRTSPKIIFSKEVELLETGGGIKNALNKLGDNPFFAVNTDVFWLNGPSDALGRLSNIWDPEKMDALLLLHSTVNAYGYSGKGDFNSDPSGQLSRRPESEIVPWLFTGIQILKPEVLLEMPEGPFSLNLVFDHLIETKRLYGVIHDGEWFHVGTPQGLAEAEAYLKVRYPVVKHR